MRRKLFQSWAEEEKEACGGGWRRRRKGCKDNRERGRGGDRGIVPLPSPHHSSSLSSFQPKRTRMRERKQEEGVSTAEGANSAELPPGGQQW